MISLQTTADLKEIISTNDATITGVLIAVCLTFGITIIYLFKQNQAIHNKFIDELKATNDVIIKVYLSNNDNTQKFHDFAKDLIEIKQSIINSRATKR
jgi:CRISPR/Cas system-associated endonuclease Cas1